MKKYIFLWELSTGYEYNRKNGCFEKAEKYPVTMLGSDGCVRVDARMNGDNICKAAMDLVNHTKRAIGFSVGELTCHDPENKAAQKFIKFTLVR